jgi:hypothetical protein
MADVGLPYVLDGSLARLMPAGARSLAAGPGRLGRGGAAAAVLFDAGAEIGGQDLFAGFWRDEATDMDWLEDFLCDAATDDFFDKLAHPPAPEEEPEEMYAKAQLTTLGSDVVDDI